ncbi:MAG: PDDEXK nuclease domain-containing protein [Candidatus Omnitrophota bacterium]
MKYNLVNSKEYKVWLADIKARVRNAQIKAALSVNTELLKLYWSIGADIVARQKNAKWGDSFLLRLSKDLMSEFPDMKGFSKRNLELIRQWHLFYSQIAKQAVSQLPLEQITQIPWGHNIAIIAKCKDIKEALYYVQNTITHNWSRNVLVHQIESALYRREGRAVTNFPLTLPKPQSDLARQTLKDPYVFDFLSMSDDYNERDLEKGLTVHLTNFLLELGAGFSFIGRQVSVQVGTKEFFIDLLFYHTRLHCYIVVELKTGDFEPAYAGQLNFYIKAVDSQLRKNDDHPTIGLLLCKSREKLVAEYALSDIHKPIGVSEYKLTHSLPKKLKSSLPTIKEIEKELSKGIGKAKK